MKSAAVGVILVTFACVSSASAACSPDDFNAKLAPVMERAKNIISMGSSGKFASLDKGQRNDTANGLIAAQDRVKDSWNKCVQDKAYQTQNNAQYKALFARYQEMLSKVGEARKAIPAG
jgi:hypothetical protein